VLSRFEIFLVLLCLTLTGVLYTTSLQINTNTANAEFKRLAEDNVQALQDRMAIYLQTIKGTAAFIAASDEVTHTDFAAYTKTLEIKEQLPSMSGLGLIVEVPATEIDGFVETIRAGGRPDFQVRRKSNEETHLIIKFMEPSVVNSRAIGIDVNFAPERASVLLRARDTAAPQMTPPIQLVQEDKPRPGFVMFMPILSQISGADAAPQFLGWVNAAFVAENLLQGLTSSQGELYFMQVFDKSGTQEVVSIYDGIGSAPATGKYAADFQLDQFGRTWTLTFTSSTDFDAIFKSNQPLAILVAGTSLTTILLLILRSLQNRAKNLRKLAVLRNRQIKAREEENRAIVENAVTSVIVFDDMGKILVANQAAQQCFGYTESELQALNFHALALEVKQTDGTYNAKGCTKDGSTLELDLQCNQWLTSEGKRRTTAIIRDLTEQNKAQRELKRLKALTDKALQGAEIGIFEIDLRTQRSEVSETWCRIMGYSENCNNVDTQRSFLSRIHPDDLKALEDADAACIEGRTPRSITEFRLKTIDGGWCWMRSDAVVAERDANGNALRLIGTQTDVTELRHDRNALEASELQIRKILESAPIGMAVMDEAGRFRSVNSAFCKLAGHDEEYLITHGRMSEMMPTEDCEIIRQSVRGMISAGNASIYTGEHRIGPEGDDQQWGLLNVSWSFDKNEGTNLFIAQIIDITDQKKLEKIKGEFVSTVSHELRTPLTSIKGALGLLTASEDSDFSTSQTRLIEIAKSNADRLTDIVNDILDLEKISSGEISFDFEDIELSEIVEMVAQEMAPFAVTHDSTLRLDLPPEQLSIFADVGRTKQVLANLVSNACKYSHPDSEVLVKVERLDDMAIVYVQNIGTGVPDSFKGSIFKAFSQADSSDTRAKGGTGLGLNISRQIVRRQGGQIGYESVANGITVFWFTVPLSQSAHDTGAKKFPTEVASGARKLSVLHIEDDYDFAEVVAETLHSFANVSHASSIASARVILNGPPVDAILLDWSLPDGDADNLLADLQRLQPSAKIIALSADAERPADPRLFANMVKSRTDLETVARSVFQCHPMAS